MSQHDPPSTTDTRRSFIAKSAAVGVGAGMAGVFARPAAAQDEPRSLPQKATSGDVDILKFLAAAELVEDDLWQQYCELAVRNRPYRNALERIDPSLIRYICDDRDDERSHAEFINAYLGSIGQTPVNLDPFRTLPGSRAQGSEGRGRLTNLSNLTIDTSWYNRYRGRGNPDFGDTFPQVARLQGVPTIPSRPRNVRRDEAQALAHAAAFHFGTIEQGGGSLYTNLLSKVTSLDAVIILSSIGPTEIYHFAAFHKSLENLPGFQGFGVSNPNLRSDTDRAQAIFPEPCKFFGNGFPLTSVIRPRETANAGAVASATALVQSGLFQGQPQAFLDAVVKLAKAADAAVRGAGMGSSAPTTGYTGAAGATGAAGSTGATGSRGARRSR